MTIVFIESMLVTMITLAIILYLRVTILQTWEHPISGLFPMPKTAVYTNLLEEKIMDPFAMLIAILILLIIGLPIGEILVIVVSRPR